MSKQAAYPLPQETEELLKRVNPTGTAHTLTLTVSEPSSGNLSMTISNPRLEIKNGDKVTWNVELPATRNGWEVVIQFNGSRFMDGFAGRSGRNVSVPGDILGSPGSFQDSKERYSVTLVNPTTLASVAVSYPPSTTSDPTPYLVIDDIGNPTTDPRSDCGHRWGQRRNRRGSK